MAVGKKKGKAARGDPTAEELFNTIYKNERTAVAEEVNAWIEMYKREQTKALTVLVSVLFRMCGCDTDLTAAQMEEEEVCGVRVCELSVSWCFTGCSRCNRCMAKEYAWNSIPIYQYAFCMCNGAGQFGG